MSRSAQIFDSLEERYGLAESDVFVPDVLPLHECALCGRGIYEGEAYYEIDDTFCTDCIFEARREAHA